MQGETSLAVAREGGVSSGDGRGPEGYHFGGIGQG